MLFSEPDILRNNPECYTIEFGKGYVPTAIATEEEKKAVEEFNRKLRKGRERMIQIEDTAP